MPVRCLKPFVVGVTGGVGAGKSACLRYMEEHCRCLVVYADDEAAKLRRPGGACYEPLVTLLGSGVLTDGGEISAKKMAAMIFADPALLAAVNTIIHPAVNARIKDIIEAERAAGTLDFLFIEAALLIENGYEALVDEMWYIYAEEGIRRERLRVSRGYSDGKIDDILAGQLTDAEFRRHCEVVIDNGGDFEETARRINAALSERMGQRDFALR